MARVKAGARHATLVGWKAQEPDLGPSVPDTGSATRSEVRAVVGDASPNPSIADSKVVTPARAVVLPSPHPRSGTMVGMTGIGGGASPQERNPAVTVYDTAASENAAADYELFSNAIGLLKEAGVDKDLARDIVLGEVAKEQVDGVRAYLASLGVDQKTCLAVLWGRRIVALPVITPSIQSSSSAVPNVQHQGHGSLTLPPPERCDSPVDAVSGNASANGSVVLDSGMQEDVAMVAAVAPRSNRALVAAVLVGLGIAGAIGYNALNSFVDNVAHSTPTRR